MTTVPAKHHQRLHNFSLPFLKWGQRIQINNHCRRRDRHSNRNTRTDSDAGRKPHRSRDRTTELTQPNNNSIDELNGDVSVEKLTDVDVVTAVDGDVKLWNLRPRRLVIGAGDGNGAVSGVCGTKSGRLLRGGPVAGAAAAATAEENDDQMMKKRRLWISLSKEEIEEDVYAFSGSKPARRPKKRSKTAQKQVDNCFPGLYLVGISADSYRV